MLDPPATRVWACEMRDSSGATVATAWMVWVNDSRPTSSIRTPSACSIDGVTSTGTRSGIALASMPAMSCATATGAAAGTAACSRGEKGHPPRAC